MKSNSSEQMDQLLRFKVTKNQKDYSWPEQHINYDSELLFLVPKLGASEHKHLHNASSKLELRSSADSGNYVVANEEIKAGETIVVEKPIAACLLPKYFGSHCLHCLRRYAFHQI